MRNFLLSSLLCCAVAFSAAAVADQGHHHGPLPGEKLGSVHFPISCSPTAQAQFDRSLAMLHSFWYEEAVRNFALVTEKDPQCAMGYWGSALALYHQLWPPYFSDPAAEKSGEETIAKAKTVGAKTQRERDYISALATFYKDSDKLGHKPRALAYEKLMDQLSQRYPQDHEAGVFYSLALISNADPKDKTLANYRKAGMILEKIYAQQPNHPGVIHYIIHAYDNPTLASRALNAARSYAKVAPSVPHALHMPSHIFTRLGLWQDSIASNRAAANAAKDYAMKIHAGPAWDQHLHPMDYLMYAYLQSGQDNDAKALLDEVNSLPQTETTMTGHYALSAIPARYAVERGRWAEAASLQPHPNADRISQAITYWARGLGAARSGNVATAHEALQKVQEQSDALAKEKDEYWSGQVDILREELAGWIARAQENNDTALKRLRAAVEMEDATDKSNVTPGSVLPAHEMYADLLLELKHPADALAEYEASLRTAPNRFHGLYGAAQAAELAGQKEKARVYYAKLVEICKKGDADKPELKQAMAFLAKK